MSIILKVYNLSKSFGGIHANSNISFEVKKGEGAFYGPKIDFDPDEEICQEIADGRCLDVLEIDDDPRLSIDLDL